MLPYPLMGVYMGGSMGVCGVPRMCTQLMVLPRTCPCLNPVNTPSPSLPLKEIRERGILYRYTCLRLFMSWLGLFMSCLLVMR